MDVAQSCESLLIKNSLVESRGAIPSNGSTVSGTRKSGSVDIQGSMQVPVTSMERGRLNICDLAVVWPSLTSADLPVAGGHSGHMWRVRRQNRCSWRKENIHPTPRWPWDSNS